MATARKAADVSAGHGEPDGCPSDEQIALLRQWDAVQAGMRRFNESVLEDVHRATGLAPSSFQVLWFLLTAPEQTAQMSQLSRTLGFSTAGTTKVADRLCEAGLVERQPHPADRRVTLASLTAQGRAAATRAALTLADALEERLVALLERESLEALAAQVSRIDPEPAESHAVPKCAQ